jgi:hypothetical protein
MKQRPFCDQRPSMRTNVLLRRPKDGEVIRVTRDLPPADFAYTPQKHDGYGVREIFAEWEQNSNPLPSTREIAARRRTCSRQDFIATNRAALKAGSVTAREFREFKKSHEILVNPDENYDVAVDQYNKTVRQNMVHGKPTPVISQIRDCLTWQGGREEVEKGRRRQARRHAPSTKKMRKRINHGVTPTRASRGHTVKPPAPPTHGDMFKIKRFENIDHYAIDDTWQ